MKSAPTEPKESRKSKMTSMRTNQIAQRRTYNYMEWDFGGAVIAKWVQGPMTGKVVKSTLSAFTKEKWMKMDAVHSYGVAYAEASARQKSRRFGISSRPIALS